MGNDVYTVVGILHTGLDAVDRGLVLMTLSTLQDLLHLAPARIHEVGIKLTHINAASNVAAALQLKLGKTLPVRVMAWPELAPELANYVQFNHGVTVVLFFIFFLVAVIGVMNTMLMAVYERTREFGMLMAVGMRPAQVIELILTEAAGLGVAESGRGSSAWSSTALVFAGARSGLGWRYRRGGLRRRSGGGPSMVRPAGFSRVQPGSCRARRNRPGVCALSRMASR